MLDDLKTNGLPMPTMLYSQCCTGSVESLHFLWKVTIPIDEEKQARTCLSVDKQLPVYHSKMVRNAFIQAASKLNVKPMCARLLYKIATDDASATENATVSEIDERLLDMIRYEDSSIVMDLRTVHQVGDSAFESVQ